MSLKEGIEDLRHLAVTPPMEPAPEGAACPACGSSNPNERGKVVLWTVDERTVHCSVCDGDLPKEAM